MKSIFLKGIKSKSLLLASLLLIFVSSSANAQFSWGKAISSAKKVANAITLSDDDIRAYVAEYVAYSDKQNKIAPDNSPYTIRLKKLTEGIDDLNGLPLNFKVYVTDDVNAFACADGSIRVYTGLMDLMSDDEVLGVIGHEIGHVAHADTKNAFKNALLTSALLDGVGAVSSTARVLTDSQLGALGETLVNSKFSQKQESNADDYGYDFLKSKGKNPWAMAMAFSKLKELESGAKASALQKMFSSHPSTDKRIKHIVDKCKKDKIAAPEGCKIQ